MAEPSRSLEAFTADLQREAQALGITPQNYLEAAREPKVVHRGQNLPFVEYDDGSIGWGMPQVYYDLKDSWGQFTRAAEQARGSAEFAPEQTFPRLQDVGLAGAAVAGAGLGHLGLRGRSASSVAGTERAAAPSGLPSSPVGAGSGPVTARVYRGLDKDEQWPPSNPQRAVFWSTDSPKVANSYAAESIKNGGAAVLPADISFQRPMVVDAQGSAWHQIPFGKKTLDSDGLSRLARERGHDGLVIRNVMDSLDEWRLSDTYGALQPGTVKSPLTGETLFSNPKEGGLAGWLASALGRNETPPVASGLPSHSVEAGREALRLAPTAWADNPNLLDIYRGNQKVGKVDVEVSGDTVTIHDISVGTPNAIGVGGLRELREAFRKIHPEVVHFKSEAGERVTGARNGLAAAPNDRTQKVTLFSNAPSASPLGLLPVQGEGGEEEFKADLRRQAIELGLIEGSPLEGVRVNPVDNYLQMAQSENDGDAKRKLRQRGYLDKSPPVVSDKGALGSEQTNALEAYMKPRIDTLIRFGVPGPEAYDLIRAMPDVESLFERLGQEGQADPQVQERVRKLLDDMR